MHYFLTLVIYILYLVKIKNKRKGVSLSKLIIFDNDGTLFDTHNCIYRAWLKIGEGFGYPDLFKNEEGFEEIYKKHHGDWCKYSVEELGFETSDFDRIVEIWLSEIGAIYKEHATWFDGMKEVLLELEEKGYTIAIATNNTKNLFIHLFDEINRSYPVHDRISHEKAQKPEPNMIIDHMVNLGFSPDKTYMVGDTKTDLLAAKAAGVTSILAGYGALNKDEEILGLSNHSLEHPRCLLKILEKRRLKSLLFLFFNF